MVYSVTPFICVRMDSVITYKSCVVMISGKYGDVKCMMKVT